MMRFGGNGGFGHMRGGGMMGNGFGLAGHILGALVLVALLTLIVIILIRVIKNKNSFLFHHKGHPQLLDNALEILNVRYAKGEISDEEYLKKKTEITKT